MARKVIAEDDYRGSWSSDVICGAIVAGIITALIICLPVIAPYGITDLFDHPGLEAHR